MAITAAEIHNQSFAIDRKGYDVDEVDVFLEHVADEIDNLNAQIADLESQLDEAEAAANQTKVMSLHSDDGDDGGKRTELSRRDARIAELENQLKEKQADSNAIAQALIIAQRSADDILERAENQANETIQRAREEAQRIIDRANNDRLDVVNAIEKLKDAREDARTEYSDLLKDIIADASRKLASIGTTSEFVASEDRMSVPATAQPVVPAAANDLTDEFEILDLDEAVAEYTTPQAGSTHVAAAEPIASAYEKDLSGFGDADDSVNFDEID